MARSSRPNDFSDISSRAQSVLDHILTEEEVTRTKKGKREVPVSEALAGERVVRFSSDRTRSRVLFISSNPKDLQSDSHFRLQLPEIKDMFDEVHFAVVTSGSKRVFPTERLGTQSWLYEVNYSSTWFFEQTMESFAEDQLQFGQGFRPDVIVALDPYMAGWAAITLAQRYDRPVQVHVHEDFLAPAYVEAHPENKEKVKLARWVVKTAPSVRAASSALKETIERSVSGIKDLGVLPKHFDANTLLKASRTDLLKEMYPQYVFFMLTIGTLDQNNTIYRVMDAARSMLFSPRICLIVMGDGPLRTALMERAGILNIKEQIIFERNLSRVPEYLMSADLFITADTTASADEYVIQAAAAGLPIVAARTPLRDDLFEDGTSALLCAPEDTVSFERQIKAIINTAGNRLRYGVNARNVIRDRLHTDPELYKRAYRDTIEMVFEQQGPPDRSNEEPETQEDAYLTTERSVVPPSVAEPAEPADQAVAPSPSQPAKPDN